MNANRIKSKLAAGQPAIGVSVMIPSPQIVEMIGRLGFDWVLLDCEHGTMSLESLEMMAMAAEVTGMTAIARPASNNPELIMQVLDRGAQGVQVPHVNTAAEARAAVAAARHDPQGHRGLAVGTRAARYGFDISLADYTAESNRETLVAIQIEEQAALENLDELVEVEGVDVLFVGPSDLSQSLGYPGRSDAPPVRDAIRNALERIVAAGKFAGSAGSAKTIEAFISQGASYVYTHLPKLLASASREFLASFSSKGPSP